MILCIAVWCSCVIKTYIVSYIKSMVVCDVGVKVHLLLFVSSSALHCSNIFIHLVFVHGLVETEMTLLVDCEF